MPVTRSVIYPNEIDRILKMPGGPVGVAVRRVALDIASEAETIAKQELGNRSPFDAPRTGKYARSFEVKVDRNAATGFEFSVSNRTPYAAVLEGGSTPHSIEAKKRVWLRFRDRQTGQWRTVKAVNHPGQKIGYRILQRAMEIVVRRTLT